MALFALKFIPMEKALNPIGDPTSEFKCLVKCAEQNSSVADPLPGVAVVGLGRRQVPEARWGLQQVGRQVRRPSAAQCCLGHHPLRRHAEKAPPAARQA